MACGSRLACEGIAAVRQANRIACIASKPAPTQACQPQLLIRGSDSP